jgi:GNAT superfamily N-acetyltransferase
MNLKKYAKIALFLTVCAFAPVKGMQAKRLEAYAQFLADAKHRHNQELFAQHLDESAYPQAIELLKIAPKNQLHEYVSLIIKRLGSLNYNPLAGSLLNEVIKISPAHAAKLIDVTCAMEDEDARARVVLMLSEAYCNMDTLCKTNMREKLGLHFYELADARSFMIAAKTFSADTFYRYECNLIHENIKTGYVDFKFYPKSREAHIDYLHVTERDARGIGHGSVLLKFALATLKQFGCKKVELYAQPLDSNGEYEESELIEKLLCFYARHGFWSKDGSRMLVQDLSKKSTSIAQAKL